MHPGTVSVSVQQPKDIRLLCLPCAGASATMYLRWRRQLPAWVTLHAVELPGRGARLGEPLETQFDVLVAKLCEELAAAMRGHFALFGHSMGAILVYGIAQRLRCLGRPLPAVIVASASPAPSARDPERFANTDSDDALVDDLRTQGGTPEEVFANAELLRMTLDTLWADYRVCESFADAADAAPLPMPLHVMAGRDDDIESHRIEAWRASAAAGCALHWFDGGHFFIRQNEPAVLATLTSALSFEESRSEHVALAGT